MRYRARIELSGHDTEEVVNATRAWAAGLDESDADYEHHLLEALWMHQQHNRMDRGMLVKLLGTKDAGARAAATRVLRYGRHLLPDALDLLAPMANDENPRVRLETVVACSFFSDARAADIALTTLNHPGDKFLDYALDETMVALEEHWKAALREGTPIAVDNPAGGDYLLSRVGTEELLNLPRRPAVLEAILTRHGPSVSDRSTAALELAGQNMVRHTEVVLTAIRTVDSSGGGHAAHILHDLWDVLGGGQLSSQRPRAGFAQLAENGRLKTTRAIGYAGMMVLDAGANASWKHASENPDQLVALFEALPMIESRTVQASMHDRIRPLMFSVPARIAEASTSGGGSGLDVDFFEPAPRDATQATFEGLTPSHKLTAANFTLDLAPAKKTDSFGVSFRGTVHAPTAGSYTFWTNSDDGSRLYIGDTCVVDNDGAHGMAAKSGKIELGAGPHPILVTFYEQGGAEGLQVSWKGPGIKKQPIPDAMLGRSDARTLRAAAIRAMAHVPGHAEEKLADAARLLGDDVLLAPTMEMVASVPELQLSAESARPVLDTLAAYVSGLAPEKRTSPDVAAALAAARELAKCLPDLEEMALVRQLEGLGGTLVLIRTLPHQMLYDLAEFSVEAGKPVSIVFQNNDLMPHNLVITVPGAMRAVGEAAELLSGQPGAEAKGFIPDVDGLLWYTRLLFPGESQRLDFVAPDEPGDHPYVCTYPGHWRVMNGVMHVVRELGDGPAVVRRESDEAAAPMREFVRNWTFDELKPRFAEGWEEGRSTERGRELFTDAGCIKCHTVGDEGAVGGPVLTAVGGKYRGGELLHHIVEPSLEVLEDYRFWGFDLDDGTSLVGRVLDENDDTLRVVQVLLKPDEITTVEKAAITDRWDTQLSPMPTGLLVTLDEEEIMDLIAFLQEEADKHAAAEAEKGDPWVVYEGGEGPGKGKHIVLIAGDDEYRSEEALPMLGRILAKHHGFKCTVLFPVNPDTGEIQPDFQTNIPGMHFIGDADMVVCFLRFRELPDADMEHFVDYIEAGKPILGIRTATHAFRYKDNRESPYAKYDFRHPEWKGGFGQQILGDTWISHHGHHGSQSTRGVIEPGNERHPILRGVEDVWGPTDVYGIKNLDDRTTILLRGAVLEDMTPEGKPVDGAQNDPMIPLAWVRELPQKDGSMQRVICSTIGASTDCECEDLRRFFVNACYWGVGMEDAIRAEGKVDYVGDYKPTAFGFGSYTTGLLPKDYALD